MWIVIHAMSVVLAQSASPTVDAAWSRFWREMIIEGAGIFWIVAELGILFAVSVGGRVLRERPLPDRLRLTRREVWTALGLVGFSIALIAGIYGRLLIWPPMPVAIEQAAALERGEIIPAVYAAVAGHTRAHIAIWCTFIAAWVVLETLIVIQGIRAFHALRDVIQAPSSPVPVAGVAAAGAVLIALLAADASAQFSQAVESALRYGYRGARNDAAAGYRFMELYLRVAGAVWIAVEWVAAVYLIRGYFLLRRFFGVRGRVA